MRWLAEWPASVRSLASCRECPIFVVNVVAQENMSELADSSSHQDFFAAWQKRLKALRNVPPLLRMIWQSGPTVVTANVLLRIVTALIPVSILAVTRLIINDVEAISTHQRTISAYLWWLIALEFLFAGANSVLCRVIDFLDALFADKFTYHISTRIMS